MIKQFIRFSADNAGLAIPLNSSLAIYFLDNAQMIQMNIEFLGHDYLTDVICFNYISDDESFDEESDDEVAVEIFISPGIALKRVNDKAVENNYSKELALYVIHGILHAAGYNDKSENEKVVMYKKQDEILQAAFQCFEFQELFPLN